MKIDRKNIGEFYKKVNSKIDHFFGKGVTSEGLKRYLKPNSYGIKRFIEREELEDIEEIEKVIQDCVEDRVAIDESIMTFESFENSLKKFSFDLSQDVDQNTEKIISDLYRVSLGHVEHLDKMGKVYSDLKTNSIKIEGVGLNKKIYVFTSSKIKEILLNVCNKMYDIISQEEFKFPLIDISVKLDSKIDKELFVGGVYNDIIEKKEDIIKEMLLWETNSEYVFKTEKNGVFVFEKQ